ncbi:protein of unknown function [Methylorubrum extorquens DM4]|uniref:Uncharacterized protein n=1 Tax=Methylorubrum extorquens (strain DSM 6343 / CIP 106787 / DM4) TaxID=661410 RepID=C7CFD6_METED|nr:protein of unknown function [Methylorubrum extorquens DM4]
MPTVKRTTRFSYDSTGARFNASKCDLDDLGFRLGDQVIVLYATAAIRGSRRGHVSEHPFILVGAQVPTVGARASLVGRRSAHVGRTGQETREISCRAERFVGDGLVSGPRGPSKAPSTGAWTP